MKQENDHLYSQLVKLGDMIGDGLHHEPGGKWITKEYINVARALGLTGRGRSADPAAKSAKIEKINSEMALRISGVKCQKCQGELKQTRSGSMRGKCLGCGSVFQLLKLVKRKGGGE